MLELVNVVRSLSLPTWQAGSQACFALSEGWKMGLSALGIRRAWEWLRHTSLVVTHGTLCQHSHPLLQKKATHHTLQLHLLAFPFQCLAV